MGGQPGDSVHEHREYAVMAPVLALFDPNQETILSGDSSSHGIGEVLLQKQAEGERKPVAYKSRALSRDMPRFKRRPWPSPGHVTASITCLVSVF